MVYLHLFSVIVSYYVVFFYFMGMNSIYKGEYFEGKLHEAMPLLYLLTSHAVPHLLKRITEPSAYKIPKPDSEAVTVIL